MQYITFALFFFFLNSLQYIEIHLGKLLERKPSLLKNLATGLNNLVKISGLVHNPNDKQINLNVISRNWNLRYFRLSTWIGIV